MRLAALPSLPANLVSSLESCGIITEIDLLFSASTLEILRRLTPGNTSLQELERFKALVANSVSAPGHSAAELSKETEEEEEDALLSGIPQLDEILSGLTLPGRLIEVSGDKKSGKSSLLLHLVLRHLVHCPGSNVLWVDTTGDFSAVRAADILASSYDSDASLTLDRLEVSAAFDVDALHEILEELRSSLCSGIAPPPRTRALVVDTITPLLGPFLSPVSSQGHAIMTSTMQRLRGFAQAFSMTVFVVNDSVAFSPYIPGSASNTPHIRKPALGPSFTFLADATLWLVNCEGGATNKRNENASNCTKHIAQVYRSKVTTSQIWRSFEMRQGIISP
ncbi:P-loop containing nucleoside triphosphate hydrolase protein [Favolaschia claudopus]|uniref:P-loop containing nucleoside triphosphate hydrolase protein n=1 Tax=Favolaschia claudopus TaxID=2862362 RepID=A0AAW0EAH0_9AGAR